MRELNYLYSGDILPEVTISSHDKTGEDDLTIILIIRRPLEEDDIVTALTDAITVGDSIVHRSRAVEISGVRGLTSVSSEGKVPGAQCSTVIMLTTPDCFDDEPVDGEDTLESDSEILMTEHSVTGGGQQSWRCRAQIGKLINDTFKVQ